MFPHCGIQQQHIEKIIPCLLLLVFPGKEMFGGSGVDRI